MANNTTKNIPTEISYNDDDIARMGRRAALPPGWHQFVVIDAQRDISKNNHLMLVLEVAALKDPTDASTKIKPTMRHRITLPLTNHSVPGHKAPNTKGFAHAFLMAIAFEGVLARPERDQEDNLVFNGEIIDGEAAKEAYRSVDVSVADALITLWKSPELLVDEAFYGEVEENGDYSNIGAVAAELPQDASLVDMSDGETFVPEAAEKPATETPAKTAKGKGTPTTVAGKKGTANGKAARA